MAEQQFDDSPLESIPDADQIRDRLSRLFAEAKLLRALLKLSETKSRHFGAGRVSRPQEVAHA